MQPGTGYRYLEEFPESAVIILINQYVRYFLIHHIVAHPAIARFNIAHRYQGTDWPWTSAAAVTYAPTNDSFLTPLLLPALK